MDRDTQTWFMEVHDSGNGLKGLTTGLTTEFTLDSMLKHIKSAARGVGRPDFAWIQPDWSVNRSTGWGVGEWEPKWHTRGKSYTMSDVFRMVTPKNRETTWTDVLPLLEKMGLAKHHYQKEGVDYDWTIEPLVYDATPPHPFEDEIARGSAGPPDRQQSRAMTEHAPTSRQITQHEGGSASAPSPVPVGLALLLAAGVAWLLFGRGTTKKSKSGDAKKQDTKKDKSGDAKK